MWRSLDFISLAGTYVAVAVVVSYFTSHFCFGGELQWLSGITACMIGSKIEGTLEFKKTPSSSAELWKD